MPTSDINGVRIHWQLQGAGGDPVVFVHGSWGDHRNWAAVVPGLARRCRVLTYDRRGHSRSERPSGQGSVREDVADLAALLADRGLAPAHIVGNSFGSSIVLRLAGERPELFRSAIVHEPPLFDLLEDVPEAHAALSDVGRRIESVASRLTAGDTPGGTRQFVETIAFGPGSWPSLPDDVRETFVFNAPTWLDEIRDPEALALDVDRLTGFAAPTLLTLGDQSPSFYSRVVERVAAALPEARVEAYPGAGHVPHVTHPEAYVRVVQAFIDEHPAGP